MHTSAASLIFQAIVVWSLYHAEAHKPASAWPVLAIKQITVPKDRSKPLTITFTLSADGKGPVAISGEQFSLHISSRDEPDKFVSKLKFAKHDPKVFIATKDKSVALTATASRDRFRGHGWNSIDPGEYSVRVFINSGKEQRFDYQWLGQTCSAEHILKK